MADIRRRRPGLPDRMNRVPSMPRARGAFRSSQPRTPGFFGEGCGMPAFGCIACHSACRLHLARSIPKNNRRSQNGVATNPAITTGLRHCHTADNAAAMVNSCSISLRIRLDMLSETCRTEACADDCAKHPQRTFRSHPLRGAEVSAANWDIAAPILGQPRITSSGSLASELISL